MSKNRNPNSNLNLNFIGNFEVLVLLAVFAALWLWHLTAVSLSSPADSIEQLIWSHSPEWGYYKHPPLPTLVLYPLTRIFGYSEIATSVLGAMVTLSAMLIFRNLISQIWGQEKSYIALLAALCITFYNGRLNYYNHNVWLLFFVSVNCHCWWKLLTTQQVRWWLAIGVSAGLGVLSKYQFGLMLIPSLILAWYLKPWKNLKHFYGLSCGLLVAILLILPHLNWLIHEEINKTPFEYAIASTRPLGVQMLSYIEFQIGTSIWVVDLFLNRCLPAVLFLGALKLFNPSKSQAAQPPIHPLSGERFLLIWGITPILTMTLMGLTVGTDLQLQWGTGFAIWLVPILMMVVGIKNLSNGRQLIVNALIIFLLIQSCLMFHSYQTSAYGCCQAEGRWRLFDSQTLAKELDDSARRDIGGTFRIISGPYAAAVALALPDQPKVLIENNLKISPWVRPEELSQQGVIELWPPQNGPDSKHPLPSGWSWTPYKVRSNLMDDSISH